MKKVLSIFLLGQIIICCYIFNKSIFDIYGLNNIGDTSLKPYIIENIEEVSNNDLKELYNNLSERKIPIQVVKMPITNDERVIYEIYNNDKSKMKKIKSITNNIYEYKNLNDQEFADSTGIFYSDIDSELLIAIEKNNNIKIVENSQNSIQYSSIIKNNMANILILLILSQLVITIYTITKSKKNAVKKMLGYSSFEIIKAVIKEFILLEAIILLVVLSLDILYYFFVKKISFFYIIFITLYLLFIVAINICMVLITQISIKKLDISSALKNRLFSNKLNIFLHITKIVLIVMCTISISQTVKYYRESKKYSKEYEKYNELNNLYSSYGFNSDEYDKIINNIDKQKEYSSSVKDLYLKKYKNAYVMQVNVLDYLRIDYLKHTGKSKEDVLNSYTENYMVLNQNYLNEYTDINIKDKLIEKNTIIVPEKYKNQENEVKEYFAGVFSNLINYGEMIQDKILDDNINIFYVENNKNYEILSTFQHDDDIDINIIDPIIVVDTGSFSGTYYMDCISNSNLAFKFDSREVYNDLLITYNLDKLLGANTMYTPFMSKVEGYKFLMNQSLVFSILFLVTIIFVIYISNIIDVCVHRKAYGLKYIMGYSIFKVLKINIYINIVLLIGIIGIFLLKGNLVVYMCIVSINFLVLLYIYNKIIKNDVYISINGGD